jgi:DNA-binding phage protein
MVTRQQLADRLKLVNVREVAREAGVSTKTIYRLRHSQNSPSLDTVERILSAIKRVKRISVEA